MKAVWKHLLSAAVLAVSTSAFAQAYPSKPIRFVSGFPAGSTSDVVSRIVIDDIRARTGATIVVDNRPGALGSIGMQAVIAAPADGYTLLSSSSATHSSGPYLSVALQKIDPGKTLRHLGRFVRFDVAVVTSATGPYSNARALIEAAKARPEALTYGYGSGTGQVGAAAFSRAAAINVRGIPYKGQPLAIADLLGGQVDFVASDLGAVLSLLKSGRLSALAVLSDRRSSVLPDVPTAREAGLASVSLQGWIGIDGPLAMPADVVAWWSEQITASLGVATVQENLRTLGMEPAPLVGDAFQKFVASEQELWGKHVRDAGLKPE